MSRSAIWNGRSLDAIRSVVEAQLCTNALGWSALPRLAVTVLTRTWSRGADDPESLAVRDSMPPSAARLVVDIPPA